MNKEQATKRFNALLAQLERPTAKPEEKKRAYKVLDEAFDHLEVVVSEYDSLRKKEADDAKQAQINKEANERDNKARAEKEKEAKNKKK